VGGEGIRSALKSTSTTAGEKASRGLVSRTTATGTRKSSGEAREEPGRNLSLLLPAATGNKTGMGGEKEAPWAQGRRKDVKWAG